MPNLARRALQHPITEGTVLGPVKRATKLGVDRFARLSVEQRILPDLILVGAQRCGTTAVTEAMYRSPLIGRPRMGKGAHYFSYNYHRGFEWYRSQFATTSWARTMERRHGGRFVAFDACPYYLFHPFAPARIEAELPDAKLLVMLRDPVARAHSHWVHSTAKGFEDRPFEEALELEEERLAGEVERMRADVTYWSARHEHNSYVTKGQYGPQVADLLRRFERDQVMVIAAEEFYADPDRILGGITSWLGTEPISLDRGDDRNGYRYPPLEDATRRWLIDRFRASNEELFDLLGLRYDWLS